MKTRREILAAFGFGAGVAGLGFPGMALAWGGRRRRTDCAPACPQPVSYAEVCRPCAGGYGDGYAMSCQVACPRYVSTYANGIYYYYCQCCNISGQYLIIPCGGAQLTNLPVDCTPENLDLGLCFDLSGGWWDRDHVLPRTFASAECDFIVSPEVKKPKTTDPAAKPYMDGITPMDWKPLDDQIRAGNAAVIEPVYYVQYGSRQVALYNLYYNPSPNPGSPCNLHIGFEINPLAAGNLPPGVTLPLPAPYDVAAPNLLKIQRYHQVKNKRADKYKYHVAIKP